MVEIRFRLFKDFWHIKKCFDNDCLEVVFFEKTNLTVVVFSIYLRSPPIVGW